MGRVLVGVIVGYAVWTALWLGGNQLFFADAAAAVADGEALTDVRTLGSLLGLSAGCSLLGGLVCGLLTKKRGAVLLMALLLLGTGVAVQVGYWPLMPVWYHAAFLVLLVPLTVIGGRLGGARTRVE